MKASTFGRLAGCIAALAAPSHLAGAQHAPDLTPYLIADRAAEIALARSAAPRAISDSATVLVLTRTGYVEAARGHNGFTCLVYRSFPGDADDPAFMKDPGMWNPRVHAPECHNAEATRTVLPADMAIVHWLLQGVSPADATARLKRAYSAHQFPPPAVGAMTYMLSPRQYLLDSDPHAAPHVMFYFDRSFPAAAWGAGAKLSPVIDITATDPTAPVRTLIVVVRRWSDGSAFVPGR